MNILVSNDDGINSEALHELVKSLSEIGDVYVVAPDSERSANSHHFTYKGRLRIEEKQLQGAKKAYSFWGTPCDCIHCGLQFIIKEKIDLVVSGINKGWNVSSDMIYSGTIAAAREGFMNGIPSIAISLDAFTGGDFSIPARFVSKIAKDFVDDPNNKNYFLNINVPNIKEEEIKGVKICDHNGFVKYDEGYYMENEFGVDYVVMGDVNCEIIGDPEDMRIDINAIKAGYIAISPLYTDEINHEYVDNLKQLFKNE